MALFGLMGGALAFKILRRYGSITYITSTRCAGATQTAAAIPSDIGDQKVFVTFQYNQPACLVYT